MARRTGARAEKRRQRTLVEPFVCPGEDPLEASGHVLGPYCGQFVGLSFPDLSRSPSRTSSGAEGLSSGGARVVHVVPTFQPARMDIMDIDTPAIAAERKRLFLVFAAFARRFASLIQRIEAAAKEVGTVGVEEVAAGVAGGIHGGAARGGGGGGGAGAGEAAARAGGVAARAAGAVPAAAASLLAAAAYQRIASSREGSFVDFCDMDGGAVLTESGASILDEVEIVRDSLGYRTARAGPVTVIVHPRWGKNVYIGSVVTDAPPDVISAVLAAIRGDAVEGGVVEGGVAEGGVAEGGAVEGTGVEVDSVGSHGAGGVDSGCGNGCGRGGREGGVEDSGGGGEGSAKKVESSHGSSGESGAGGIADEEDRIDGVGGDKAESRRHEPLHAAETGLLDQHGFLVVASAAAPSAVARMTEAIEGCEPDPDESADAGGFRIWTPASALPPACREWAEADAAAILQRSLPPGTPAVRLLGGAALWKRPGMEATPWHQDFAGSEHREPGSTSRRTTRHAAVWLALTATGPRSGCMRFAPSLGYALTPHQTLPRAEAPSGFETHMVHTDAAEAVAEDCTLEGGMAVVIGDQVVHASRAVQDGEANRLAFSPLFEVDCAGCPLPAGRGWG